MIARQVFYEGRVQGVGFRYTVKQTAREYDVIGWVRNLPDGRVELLVGGQKEEVAGFLEGIAESELSHFIRESFIYKPEPSVLQGLRGFEIRP